jgi:hypothetical protein
MKYSHIIKQAALSKEQIGVSLGVGGLSGIGTYALARSRGAGRKKAIGFGLGAGALAGGATAGALYYRNNTAPTTKLYKQYRYKNLPEEAPAEQAGPAEPIRLGSFIHKPDVDMLVGPDGKMSRREFLEKILGEERADKLIASSAAYRRKNRDMYRGWFRGDSVDRPVRVLASDSLAEYERNLIASGVSPSEADYLPLTSAGAHINRIRSGIPNSEVVIISPLADYSTILHELTHPDSLGRHPRDTTGMTEDRPFWLHKDVRNIKQLVANTYYGSDKKPAWRLGRPEISATLAEIRMALEKRGVDTTNPDALREAFTNILNQSERLSYLDSSALMSFQKYGWKYRNNPKFIESLVRVIMGIADNSSTRNSDTVQYA